MKIRTIFILLNCVVIFFLSVTGTVAVIGRASVLTSQVFWVLAAFCIAVLISLDIYYFFNEKLLSILEKDDWPALVQYLEIEVINKGRYSSRKVRLLAQAYLILSDTAGIMNLENKTAITNPKYVERYALLFGVARLLEKNMASATNFFAARIHSRKPDKKNFFWCRFYYGFSLFLDWHFSEAAEEFIILSKISKNPVLTGLCAWFLSEYLSKSLPDRRAEITVTVADAQKQIKEIVYDFQEWEKRVRKLSTEVHTVILHPYFSSAGKQIFSKE